MKMIERIYIQKALKYAWSQNNPFGYKATTFEFRQGSIISQLVHDIFGGEILKTQLKNKLHFYNLINGERIDFTLTLADNTLKKIRFEDLPSYPDETSKYFDRDDYTSIYQKFVNAYEEVVGLPKSK